ncbi:glycosyltransferase family 2 protein [Streptomyces sp. NPDC087440]|uniref:glycosyltransferase family 2 protein n=1 Tax=Streptomyces sp. NPDC087440 TaxID=3365790 RepID=UPI003824AA7B
MTLLPISIALSLLLAVIFLIYVTMLVERYVRYLRHEPADPSAFTWHFVIPALNEQAVLGDTLDYLTGTFPTANVWVIDDASEDATAAIATERARGNDRVRLLSRVLPLARTGKGDALNHAYKQIAAGIPADEQDHHVMIVVDADGVPSANLLQVCAGEKLFGDEGIAAVQVEVRMINRDVRQPLQDGSRFANWYARTLVRLQDIEFRGPISAMQMLRGRTGTINVGGNGQLVRMSALSSIAGETGEPWGQALLEDYELGLRLMLRGWRNAYTVDSWVEQEGLYELSLLLAQRTRWAQGSMQCLPYLRNVWASRNFTNSGLVEVTYYLFQPWMQIVGSIVFPIPVLVFIQNNSLYTEFVGEYLLFGGALMFAFYAAIGLGEFVIWGYLYRRYSETAISVPRALGWGFGLIAYNFLIYVIAWRALFRLLGGRHEWPKTLRNAETFGGAGGTGPR